MPGHYFISYSEADGRDFARHLHDALEPQFVAWFDKNDLKPGRDWDTQFRQAISECNAFLFVMTSDSIDDTCTCKQEYTDALRYKRPIVPLKVHKDAALPFLLNTRQYIDFTINYDAALTKLREYLEWLPSPEGVLQTLKDRLADANRDLRRTDDTNRARVLQEIEQLKKQFADQEKIVADPAAAAKRTEQSIKRSIEHERTSEKPISGKSKTKFINQPPGIAPSYYQDRYEENKRINKFLEDESKRLFTIVGRAGIGKTAMVCRLLKSLENGRLPDDLGELSVDGIVYLSAVGTRIVNVPNLFADLCQLLTDNASHELGALYKNPQVSTEAKINALLAAFPSGRFIVLLDNFENVLDAETMNIRDTELDEALRALLNAPHHTVKVILTTRIAPHDLGFVQPGRQDRLNLDNGLELQYAKKVLIENDADGTLGMKNAPDDLLTRAYEFTRGFPRALEALIAILRADRYTTLEEMLSTSMPENVVEVLVGEAFSRLDPIAQRVMQALAVYNRPVTPTAVDYLLQPYVAGVNSDPVLNRLVTMQFVRREAGRYYLHPVDRAYAFGCIPVSLVDSPSLSQGRKQIFLTPWFAKRFEGMKQITLYPWFAKQMGQGRVVNWIRSDLTKLAADYFAQTYKPREMWKTLVDLEPQLNEFDLRCAGEDYDTAARILLEIDSEYLLLWGHYRLTIELHEKLQGKINSKFSVLRSLNNRGLTLQSLGQVQKAINCYEEALHVARELKNKQAEGAECVNRVGTTLFGI